MLAAAEQGLSGEEALARAKELSFDWSGAPELEVFIRRYLDRPTGSDATRPEGGSRVPALPATTSRVAESTSDAATLRNRADIERRVRHFAEHPQGTVTLSFPLDPRVPRRSEWLLKARFLPWFYWRHMLRGGESDIAHKERRFADAA